MKICVISTQIFALGARGLLGYGGLEQIAWECAKGLAERGHEITFVGPIGTICPGCRVIECLPVGFGDERAAYGGCVYRNSNNDEVRWGGYWQELLHFNNGGVIIDHSWQKQSAMLKLEGRLTCPVIATLHAPVNTMISSVPPEGVVSFVCISEDQKQHFEALFSPRKARRAYNGIDLDFYKPLDVPRSNRFLFLARFSSIKGPDIAIEACKRAGVGLDLIGDTSITNEPALFQHCKNMADGEQIRIIGSISRGETVWWYSQACALLHPNQRFREPFGLAPIEAMACGCPVIAWDHGAMRETIQKSQTGFLVDSMEKLVNDIDLVKTTKQGHYNWDRAYCREWASQFSIQNMVLSYERLCEEALSKPW